MTDDIYYAYFGEVIQNIVSIIIYILTVVLVIGVTVNPDASTASKMFLVNPVIHFTGPNSACITYVVITQYLDR